MEESKYIHDMNNALTGIIGVASLLQASIETMDCHEKEELQSNIDLLMQAISRATDIVSEYKQQSN
jgi:signal transduction histidine kinase